MNTLKIFNIALFALIITLILQLVLPKPENNPVATEGIALTIEQKNITIPNIPKISIQNNSSETLEVRPCEHISLSVNTQKIGEIAEKYPDFCQEFSVLAKAAAKINFDALYQLFASVAGDYIVTLKIENVTENMLPFSVSQPGFFRTFLSVTIYQPIYNLFVTLLTVLPSHELGWAIVIVTIIIRLILLMPQHRMLENARKMGLLGPKIKSLQEQYKDDRATLGMKMMELYKKEGVNPMGSCLPLLIQLPILTGLYWVISSITEVSNFYHLYGIFSDFDPKNIDTIFFGQDLLQIGGTMGLIMVVVLMVTQCFQAYLSFKNQPKAEPKKKSNNPDEIPMPDPVMMQKMMLYIFPIMIGVMAYFFPLGLALYWWIGLLFMIVQQLYVNHKGAKEKLKGEIVKKS